MAHRGSRGIVLLFLGHGTRRGWRVSITPWALFTPGTGPVPFVQKAEWAPGPVWTSAENLAPSGFDPQTVQPVASRCTDYITWPTKSLNILRNCKAALVPNHARRSDISITLCHLSLSKQPTRIWYTASHWTEIPQFKHLQFMQFSVINDRSWHESLTPVQTLAIYAI